MNKVITVPLSYRVTLKDGSFAVFRNNNHFDNYEGLLVSGDYAVTTPTKTTNITPDSVLKIDVFLEPDGCEHCKHPYGLHAGENVCPKCEGRTFLPASETNSQ